MQSSSTLVTLQNVLDLAKTCKVYYDSPMYTPQGKYRMLQSNVSFELSDKTYLHIQKGMWWDENSIPWALQWAFPKSGMYAVAALVHDALYFNTTTSQKFADNEFKQWMKALNVTPFQLTFRYLAVRLFGGSYWNANVKKPSARCLHNRKLISLEK